MQTGQVHNMNFVGVRKKREYRRQRLPERGGGRSLAFKFSKERTLVVGRKA